MSKDIYFLIGKKLIQNERKDEKNKENCLKDLLSLRRTCKAAKRACDSIIESFKNEMVLVNHYNDGCLTYPIYPIRYLTKPDSIENIQSARKCSGFLIRGIDILKM